MAFRAVEWWPPCSDSQQAPGLQQGPTLSPVLYPGPGAQPKCQICTRDLLSTGGSLPDAVSGTGCREESHTPAGGWGTLSMLCLLGLPPVPWAPRVVGSAEKSPVLVPLCDNAVV